MPLVVIPLVAMRVTGRNLAALGIRRPQPRFVVAAALIGVSAWYLNMQLVELLPFDDEGLEGLGKLVEQPSLATVLARDRGGPGDLRGGAVSRRARARARDAVSSVGRDHRVGGAVRALSHPADSLPADVHARPDVRRARAALGLGDPVDGRPPAQQHDGAARRAPRPEWLAGWLGKHPIIASIVAAVLTITGIVLALAGPPDPLPISVPMATARPRGSP